MKVHTIVVRWWQHNPKFVGFQPVDLDEQVSGEVNKFLRSKEYNEIVDIKQSLARGDDMEVVLITIWYK